MSFNTQLQATGIALQGEVAYRKDVPLQYDDVELLFAALSPFETGLERAARHADCRPPASPTTRDAGGRRSSLRAAISWARSA